MNRNAKGKAQTEQLKQYFNRFTHSKKAYNNAQRKADALRREYHKVAFFILYGQNQPHRNHLTQAEVQSIRNNMRNFQRAFMATRTLSRFLPANMTRKIMHNIV